MFQPLPGLFEPSGIAQLPDGRFLVVEDEEGHPFSLVTLTAAGGATTVALKPGLFEFNGKFWKLDDLEGVTAARDGTVYALTSHSRNDKGEEKQTREKLVRFRVNGQRIVEPRVVLGLKDALSSRHPALAAAARIRNAKSAAGLNIEALEISADERQLLIGFRSPLLDGKAIIAHLDNPGGVFDGNELPRIARTLTTLDLGGHGIRGLAHLPALGGYLILSGPAAKTDVPFQLWFWRGLAEAPAQAVSVSGLPGFAHAEGVCAAIIDGQPKILIVSDDGRRDAGRDARYLLLDPAQLHIVPAAPDREPPPERTP